MTSGSLLTTETVVTDKELDPNAARRLAIIKHAEEVTENVALTCRYYRISRQVFYRWLRRYQEDGLAGLRDRSRRSAHCPHEAPAEVVAKIHPRLVSAAAISGRGRETTASQSATAAVVVPLPSYRTAGWPW